jgi:hypothetical protein
LECFFPYVYSLSHPIACDKCHKESLGVGTAMIEWRTFVKKRRHVKRGFPTGTVFFTGKQGAGKSLSASHYLARLKKAYPTLYIYSNIQLAIADKVIKSEEVADHILAKKFDEDGNEIPIAFFLDEIQTVLFSGKKAVSFETFKAICQQRKALKTIIGTMQEFLDLDIKYRRQLQAQVECFHFGPTQFELWKDPDSIRFDQKKNDYVGRTKKINIWKRHNEAYDIYDTYEIVNATMDIDLNKKELHQKKPLGVAPG